MWFTAWLIPLVIFTFVLFFYYHHPPFSFRTRRNTFQQLWKFPATYRMIWIDGAYWFSLLIWRILYKFNFVFCFLV